MKEHLVRERPKPAEHSLPICHCIETMQQRELLSHNTVILLWWWATYRRTCSGSWCLNVRVNESGIEKDLQTSSVSDNKVSPSPERCWLSNRDGYLKPRSLLWSGERGMIVGPDRDSFSTCVVWDQSMWWGILYVYPFMCSPSIWLICDHWQKFFNEWIDLTKNNTTTPFQS